MKAAGGAEDAAAPRRRSKVDKGDRGSIRHIRLPEGGGGGGAHWQATVETDPRGARTLLEPLRYPRTQAHKGEWREGVSVGRTPRARGGFKGKLQISSILVCASLQILQKWSN